MTGEFLAYAVSFEGWENAKVWLTDVLVLSRDALHIHIGLGLFFIVLLVLRSRAGDLRPLFAVLLLTLLGEVFDHWGLAEQGVTPDPTTHLHDLWNTMLWPSVLTIAGRWRTRRRAAREACAGQAEGRPGN